MRISEENSWARESLAGDDAAFERLVERYRTPLFNGALRIVGDRDDAAEVVQVAFVKAYENRASFDSKHRFFSWIYKIVVHEAINHLKRTRRHDPLDGDFVSRERSPDEQCQSSEVRDAVQAAIMTLSPEQRAVLVLRHFGDLSYRDLAFALSIPEETVKSRLYAARRRVAEILRSRRLLGTDGADPRRKG